MQQLKLGRFSNYNLTRTRFYIICECISQLIFRLFDLDILAYITFILHLGIQLFQIVVVDIVTIRVWLHVLCTFSVPLLQILEEKARNKLRKKNRAKTQLVKELTSFVFPHLCCFCI